MRPFHRPHPDNTLSYPSLAIQTLVRSSDLPSQESWTQRPASPRDPIACPPERLPGLGHAIGTPSPRDGSSVAGSSHHFCNDDNNDTMKVTAPATGQVEFHPSLASHSVSLHYSTAVHGQPSADLPVCVINYNVAEPRTLEAFNGTIRSPSSRSLGKTLCLACGSSCLPPACASALKSKKDALQPSVGAGLRAT